MKVDWDQLKTAIDRGLQAAESDERGGVRVHCGAAERMLKKAKGEPLTTVRVKVHGAKTAIEISTSVQYLKEAKELVAQATA